MVLKKIRQFTAFLILAMFVMMISAGCTKNEIVNISELDSAKIGSLVQFGSYEQDNNTENGKELILWRVLAIKDGEALLLSEKILDSKPYHNEQRDISWEECTLRAWLNNEFYVTAFSPTEQAKIEISTIVNEDNPSNGTEGGIDTSDKVFLLSYADALNPAYGFNSDPNTGDTARQTLGTKYSKSNGLFVPKNKYSGNSTWWLRTVGISKFTACSVFSDGTVDNDFCGVGESEFGVRPVIWVSY